MLKFTLTSLFTVATVVGFSVAPAYGQWQGWLVKQGVKQIGKVAGKKVVNRGAEETCIYPFVCAKTANAPARTPPPRRRRNGSW